MPSKKKSKIKKTKKSLRKKAPKRHKKASGKKATRSAKKVAPRKSKKTQEQDKKLDKIIHLGRERGFITYDQILKEFPKVEEDILFLDRLYDELSVAGIDVLEGGGMLS